MPPDREEFVRRYGGIYEHSPWIADQVFEQLANESDLETLAAEFARAVDAAPRERRLALIRAHPDLAGKAAIAGELTPESNEEQASAGIDQCTPQEFARFQSLNDAYREKFGFPFVMAVRGSTRAAILSAFEERLANDEQTEFDTAIREIHKIARMRLETMESE